MKKSVFACLMASMLLITSCGGGGGGSSSGAVTPSSAQGDPAVNDAVFTEQSVLGSWLKAVDAHGNNFNFYLYMPETYSTGNASYPVVIILHGDGFGDGYNPELTPLLLNSGPLAPLAPTSTTLDPNGRASLNVNIRNSLVIYPKIPKIDRRFIEPLGYWNPNALNKIIDYVARTYRVDSTRIYVGGGSMGGGGTFHYARTNPKRVAAIIPICNGLHGNWGAEQMKGVPVWLFQSFNDTVVPFRTMILPTLSALSSGVDFMQGYPYRDPQKLQPAVGDYTVSYSPGIGLGPWMNNTASANGLINFTLYETGGHNAGAKAWVDDAMWTWLFSKTNVR